MLNWFLNLFRSKPVEKREEKVEPVVDVQHVTSEEYFESRVQHHSAAMERRLAERAQQRAEQQERNLQMPIPPRPTPRPATRSTVRSVETGRVSARSPSPNVYPSSQQDDNLIRNMVLFSALDNDNDNSRRSSGCDAPTERSRDYDAPSSSRDTTDYSGSTSSDTGSPSCD